MIQNVIYAHAAFGGIALLAGLIALIVKKGSKPHKLSGKIFFWSMITAGSIAMVISTLPDHESPFLFAIGIFSVYLITTGYRALRFKRPKVNFTFDRILSGLMLITALCMVLVPVILYSKLNIILTVFGSIGGILSIQDLRAYRKPKELRKKWLAAHLVKMIGGYISAVTAFVVVNEFFPGIIGWLAPTVVGVPFIIYWTRKTGAK